MKALKYILILVVLFSLCIPATDAFARRRGHYRRHHHHRRTSFYIGIGGYYPWHHGYYYGSYYYHPFGWPYYWDYYPYTVVERQRVIVKERPVLVQDRQSAVSVDENTQKLFASIRKKKAELLKKLQIGDKAQRIKAIQELAGLSYDDKVRERLKDILLNDHDADLRKEAAQAFGAAKNNTVLSILEKVRVDDSDVEVRKAADEAVKKIKG